MKNKLVLSGTLLAFILVILFLTVDKYEPVKVEIGQQAPTIEVVNAIGDKAFSSVDIKNKVVFVNFWASWCQPCIIEMPSINRLSNHFKNNSDFIVLAVIYSDDPKSALSFMKNNNMNLPVMIDKNTKTAKSFGVTGVPETFIIDKNSIIRGKFIGPYVWDSPEIIEDISNILQE
jgi:cytochrome c biogenesis protein CcmG/thiol:disulfide interchange protein DsbE